MTGVVSFILIVPGLVIGCRTAPAPVEIVEPPVTFVRHLDVALQLVHDGPAPARTEVYSRAAQNLGAFEDGADGLEHAPGLARRLDVYMEQSDTASLQELLHWAVMWNALASRDVEHALKAGRVSREVASRMGRHPEEEIAAPLLVELLDAQLQNDNVDEESVRRNLDELYLIGDDTVRARALVGAADLVRREGGRSALNPVVQQAIAIVPVVTFPTAAVILNARLSELSEVLGNARDVRALQNQAVRRAEAGLLVSGEDRTAIQRVLQLFVDRGDRPGAEVIVENIAPVSSRAIAYAALGAASAERDRMLPYGGDFEEAFSIAFSIDDPSIRAGTVAEITLLRVESDRDWSPSATIADLLGLVSVSQLPSPIRVDVISTLYTALIVADRAQEVTRLRGLIRSADELAVINTTVGEMLVAREMTDEARIRISRIERVPPAAAGDPVSVAYRLGRLWVATGDYDRAITILLDASPPERARVLARIPASHRPNPAAVTDLERLLTE